MYCKIKLIFKTFVPILIYTAWLRPLLYANLLNIENSVSSSWTFCKKVHEDIRYSNFFVYQCQPHHGKFAVCVNNLQCKIVLMQKVRLVKEINYRASASTWWKKNRDRREKSITTANVASWVISCSAPYQASCFGVKNFFSKYGYWQN